VVEYPDEVKTRYDRTIYEVARIPDGHKVGNFHIPLTVDGYRAIYKGYLADPTSRTRVRAGRSSRYGTTTNSRGRVGKASSRRDRSSSPARASRSQRIRPGSNIFPHVSLSGASAQALRSTTCKKRSHQRVRYNGLGVEPNNLTAINSL
jgi:alkaline phosphatase D